MSTENKHNEMVIDHHAFQEIYGRYYPILLDFAQKQNVSKEDAENITQDVFLTVWELRRDTKIQTSLSGYLYTLTKYHCIDLRRRKYQSEKGNAIIQKKFEAEMKMMNETLEIFTAEFVFEDDRIRSIMCCINSLPEKCRQIFILHNIEGKSYKEIALELHISVKTVENQITIALRKLREKLLQKPDTV